ncbi:MAG: DEAD/DEAH box helicase [Terriglobia bacterium]
MFKIRCPKDGTIHDVNQDQIGKTIHCRRCGSTLRIPAPSQVATAPQMLVPDPHFIVLKFLPDRTCEDINSVWMENFGVASEALEFLVDRLNEDRDSTCAYKSADSGQNRDEIVISTPRLRVYCFPDRFEAASLVVKKVERSTPTQWFRDRNRGVQFISLWTSQKLAGAPYLTTLIAQIEEVAAGASPQQQFWAFWSEFLDAERKVFEDAKSHPGWSYSKCRYGMNDSLEFLLDKDQDIEALVNVSRGRILLGLKDNAGLTLEIRGWSEFGWLSASPVHEPLRLEDVPSAGRLQPDWKGLRSLFRRRFDALQMLKRGDTALPSLNRMLPDGPKENVPPRPFKPLLGLPFDPDQRSAIEKALPPGTLTAVLGPPGTGKTAVIAEVAAQVALQGGRALISSQTNLAVDNALERLEQLEDVFAVRIGNPESVKLGKHLLFDHAGERYRKRLLERSRKALAEEEAWIDKLGKAAPSDDELASTLEGAWQTIQVMNEAKNAAQGVRSAADAEAKATQVWQDSYNRTERLLSQIKLDKANLAAVIQFGKKVVDHGWDATDLSQREAQLRRAYTNKPQLLEFFRLAGNYERACQQLDHDREDKEALEKRIQASEEAEKSLQHKLAENDRIDAERRRAGLFERILITLTEWKTSESELNEIRGRIRRYDRPGAERDLPVALSKLITSQKETAGLEVAIEDQGELIGIEFRPSKATLTDLSWRVQHMQRELEQAEFIAANHAFPIVVFLPHLQDLSSLVSQQEEAENYRNAACARLAEAATRAREADLLDQSLQQKGWIRRLQSCAENLGAQCVELFTHPPPSVEKLKQIEGELSAMMRSFKDRTGRLPGLRDALTAYHRRLQIAGGDFEEAVLHEANVVAATCTGIAGAKNFDATFDHVLIDEAGRATPLDLLIPMVRGKTITMVGDHFQLLPMYDKEVENQITETSELKTTLFQRVFEGAHESRKKVLSFQYRMAPRICETVTELFYKKHGVNLEPAGDACSRHHPFDGQFGTIHWVKCRGPANQAIPGKGRAPGIRNMAEVAAAIQVLRRIAEGLGKIQRDRPYEVGVIAMYRQQVKALEEALPEELLNNPALKIECGTVDSFQGREKDAIVVSVVETNPNKRRFFYDARRLNVALSRSKELLVIIGAIDVLGARRQSPDGAPNPVWDLHLLLRESGFGSSITREVFDAA